MFYNRLQKLDHYVFYFMVQWFSFLTEGFFSQYIYATWEHQYKLKYNNTN